MASVEIPCSPVMRSVTMEPFEVPCLNVEKAVKAVQAYMKACARSQSTKAPKKRR